MTDDIMQRGLRVSNVAKWEWCNEESFLRCHGVERQATVYDKAGSHAHKLVVRAPETEVEKTFFDKLETVRPFFREVLGVKIFGNVDAVEAEGLQQGIVRFIECKTRGERSVPPFLIQPAVFQLELYAWIFSPLVEKIGYKLADVHYVDFVHRESMDVIKRYPCAIDYDDIGDKVKKVVGAILNNEGIRGARETEEWKCRYCAVEFKNKCRFWEAERKPLT